jgi:hypothetical protein
MPFFEQGIDWGSDADVVWEHGENIYPNFICNYCRSRKKCGDATQLKQGGLYKREEDPFEKLMELSLYDERNLI